MLIFNLKLLFVVIWFCVVFEVRSSDGDINNTSYEFPKDFLFGVTTSAYQIEGGHDADGKGPSIWDFYTNNFPEKIADKSNGNVAADSYNKYKDDVKLLSRLGVNFYKFSISWSRILPDGYSNNKNMKGLMYYNNLIDELLAQGIQPMVTMYHWDLPYRLQAIGGWTNPYMAYYFEDYARILFSYFGDRVKYWVTLNVACRGYGDSSFPPYLNHSGIGNYLCTNVLLLAHAKAYHLYDNIFRRQQKGRVGIAIDGRWYEPGSFSSDDIEATERVRAFKLGIYLHPIFHTNGDYPLIVRQRVDNMSSTEDFMNSRLPILSESEREYIQGCYDFLGINMYTSYLVKDAPESNSKTPSRDKDMRAILSQDPAWPKTNAEWLAVYPEGLRKSLRWIKNNFDDPEIFITENGYSDNGEINDVNRIQYLQKHLRAVLEAIHEDNVNVKGYSVWSLLDNFEWTAGYKHKFGLYRVNFSDPKRKRLPKKSADWYRKVIGERRILGVD